MIDKEAVEQIRCGVGSAMDTNMTEDEAVEYIVSELEELGYRKPLDRPECGMCGGKMSENPHPDAGKPPNYLEVGTVDVCIPCTVKSRHKWAERAMKTEEQLALYRKPSPELREKMGPKLTSILSAYKKWILNIDGGQGTRCDSQDAFDQILALIVPKDKPPLLSDEEIKVKAGIYWLREYGGKFLGNITLDDLRKFSVEIAQAQRDKD